MDNVAKLSKTPKRFSGFALVIMLLLGVLAGFYGATYKDNILDVVANVTGAKNLKHEKVPKEVSDRLNEVYSRLKTYYNGKIDENTLADGAAKGFVSSLGDKYTTYFSKKETAEFKNDLSGSIGDGIGAMISIRNNLPTIVSVLKNNPAIKAGLLKGDVILKINGEDVTKDSLDSVVQKIRGQAGTTVKLEIFRNNEKKEFAITRETINNPSVETKVENGVGVMTISRFDEKTGELAKNAAENLLRQNVKSVVLDLRGNSGGYLTAAEKVAGLWIGDNVAVVEKKANGEEKKDKGTAKDILKDMKTIVLVDGGSASASEIVAGALKDYKKAELIGEKTYGKGSVQSYLDLANGASIKITVAKWFTPVTDKNIDGEGIEPNLVVENTPEDIKQLKDRQLDKALELAK